MAKPGDKQVKPAELKRIGDYVEVGAGERLEGERIDLQTVLGDELKLLDFVFINSTKYLQEGQDKSDFAVIQFNKPGDKGLYTASCGGTVVKAALREMPKNYLPINIRITWAKSQSTGRRYLMIE